MLRMMKHKASAKLEARGESDVGVETGGMTTTTTESSIVSHVPISLGSRSNASSTNSSISSAGEGRTSPEKVALPQHAMVAVGQGGFEKTLGDSSHESSHSEVASSPLRTFPCNKQSMMSVDSHNFNAMTSLLTLRKEPKILARKVSACDLSTNGEHPVLKKQRLDNTTPPTISSSTPKGIPPLSPPLLLLCQEQDASALSPLHVFVRKQIEVFTATKTELQQPAPGRKQPIKLHQVGLRCIHCRHQHTRKRVKRAVCYPSSVGRVYHSVSDMKFDHFSNCKDLPQDIRAEFERLKVQGKKSTEKQTGQKSYASSTAQYYHDAAMEMGMVDGPGGIFMSMLYPASATPPRFTPVSPTQAPRQTIVPSFYRTLPYHVAPCSPQAHGMMMANARVAMLNTSLLMSVLAKTNNLGVSTSQSNGLPLKQAKRILPLNPQSQPILSQDQTCISLAEECDKQHLNALHCFVRKHVEIFTADKSDIAAPAPGRKNRVTLGQVGVRCVHCAKLPPKERVKRAVCYPPSVNGIYHSISNMKFDHFGNCRGLPPSARAEFSALRASCGRRGTSSNGGSRGSSSTTAKYYHSSAVRKGLVDTETGIRFSNSRNETAEEKEKSPLSKTERVPSPGMTALVRAASQAV